MPKFKIGDFIRYPKELHIYYYVKSITDYDYVIDFYLTEHNAVHRTDRLATINDIDKDFILYRPPHLTQIRRP